MTEKYILIIKAAILRVNRVYNVLQNDAWPTESWAQSTLMKSANLPNPNKSPAVLINPD